MKESLINYLNQVNKEYSSGQAREHSYRPFLKELIESVNERIHAINEPKQQKVGAPDFVLLKGKTPVGYIEAKDVTIDLDSELKKKDQIKRYSALGNLCFTNYLEFRFYNGEQELERVTIAQFEGKSMKINESDLERAVNLLKNFTQAQSISVRSAKQLAQLMADKARLLKSTIYLALEDLDHPENAVNSQYQVFKNMLIHDLSKEQFADIYAQTLTYGMFAARYHDNTLDTFTRDEANRLLPKSNPFLRNFFQSIAGYNIDDRITWIVDDLAELFNHVNVHELLANFGKETQRQDVIVHFYETFLAEYDPKLRKSRGVYYTPEPVVDFMVRAVDDILKQEFGIKDGLTDTTKIDVKKTDPYSKKKYTVKEHRVQILDPATGTGTFLDKIVRFIYDSKFEGQQGLWQSYVDEHLLPRLHGFELLMASYAMAHLKLDITLSETGYKFIEGKSKRLGVYLTNSLEEPEASQRDLFSQWLSQESEAASEVKKEKPIMVVIGNPPYSVSSSNKGEWIQNLIKDYKKDLNEKKLNLDDDYVKFIRFGQYFIDNNGEGILAYISNNSFLDSVTYRKMRESLLESFSNTYIINLHGNSKKKEISPDGSVDENVFDIMQGVSINIFVKTPQKKKGTLGKVYHTDLWGNRKSKYSSLQDSSSLNLKGDVLSIKPPYYFFTPFNYDSLKEYEEGFQLNNLFDLYNSGIQTKNDSLTIKFTEDELSNVINSFKTLPKSELQDKLKINDSAGWKIDKAIDDIRENDGKIVDIQFRLFDYRKTYYTGKSSGFIGRTRDSVMKHMLKDNYGLIFKRTGRIYGNTYDHFFISKSIISEGLFAIDPLGREYLAPLYLYNDNSDQSTFTADSAVRVSNLNELIVKNIEDKLKLTFTTEEKSNQNNFSPVDLLDYIYAVLHSNSYRDKYKEYLKTDFPRIPYPKDIKKFRDLVKLGGELRDLHLMESDKFHKLITTYPVNGSNTVGNIRYENNRIWINELQYFDKVPETAWGFYIGGYQPAQKWLKDRRGRELNFEDILHYQKIIVALVETDVLMGKIDRILLL